MKQVVQPLNGGPVTVLDVPRPTVGATEVLVRTVSSVISPGTERAVTALAQSSLISKAKARPDLVRQVVKKARNEGLQATFQTVRARLSSDLPLGYSAAGVAVEVGEAVAGIRPGQLVATGGAGYANHAEWQTVPGLLCAPVPDGVNPEDAALTTISSIALHALRLAEVGPGSKVVVIGLGLIGQLAARLALASGCEVAGIDVMPEPLRVAERSGVLALEERGQETTDMVLQWSRGRGADAVLLCAAGSSSEAAQRSPALCRDRARVVVVGDVGLQLSRTPFYEKELSLLFARSYGPGRYERAYEEYGVDYPAGEVRWTEGRNFEAVLDLMASGRFKVSDLITHRFPIMAASDAYELIDSRRDFYLGIALMYRSEHPHQEPPILLMNRATSESPAVGWIGAGAFSISTLLPSFEAAGFDRKFAIASGSGLSARRVAERHKFEQVVSSADEVIHHPAVEVVVVATPHELHASMAASALRAGKHVWCEKPLALTLEELDAVETAWQESGRVLFVGYNRRWSPQVLEIRAQLGALRATVNYRVSAGLPPAQHWYFDRRQGGRLLGEVCHFVDTCAALVGSDVLRVAALAGGEQELLTTSDFVLLLSHSDGSLSAISYASQGGPTTSKEQITILGAGHTWVLDDYRSLYVDGQRVVQEGGRGGKGHQRAAEAFKRAVLAGDSVTTERLLASTRATLMAAADLTSPHMDGVMTHSAETRSAQ